jgi:hypothetical protein
VSAKKTRHLACTRTLSGRRETGGPFFAHASLARWVAHLAGVTGRAVVRVDLVQGAVLAGRALRAFCITCTAVLSVRARRANGVAGQRFVAGGASRAGFVASADLVGRALGAEGGAVRGPLARAAGGAVSLPRVGLVPARGAVGARGKGAFGVERPVLARFAGHAGRGVRRGRRVPRLAGRAVGAQLGALAGVLVL